MAALRVAFNDLQYVDQAFTPTQINATSFSVPGNQTSAIHAGRRLKLSDANIVYGTVSTASFTTVTTINVDVDGGATLTSSLSSFGIAIMSNTNDSLPRGLNVSLSAIAAVTLSVSATSTFKDICNFQAGISVSGTAVARNITKAWGLFYNAFGTSATMQSGHNIDAMSRSATGVYRVTFTNAFPTTNYGWTVTFSPFAAVGSMGPVIAFCYNTRAANSLKFETRNVNGVNVDWSNQLCTVVFWHL